MNDSCESAEQIIAATKTWLERAVLGLKLCPFAPEPYLNDRIRYSVSEQRSAEGLLEDLSRELQALRDADPQDCETTLLIHPFVLQDFLAFNDFLDSADAAVSALGLEGELQVASFHPDYRFADSDADDVANATNRSPYPTLHLLREASIERVVESIADPDAIYERNIETLRRIGSEGWDALWRDPPED